MPSTSNLELPLIASAQAQKHVTHNEALRVLDSLVQLAVLDRDLNAPPGTPAEGDRYIVKASPAPTGAWAGRGNQIAAWQDGAWRFSVPRVGWIAYAVDEGALLAWSGSAWGDFFATVTALQNLARLGLGTTADAANPFAAKLNNALWVAKSVAEGGDGDLRYKLSKESAADTLSLLFQTAFSGRAEIGLTGDDDLHFKVSPDGTTWYEGIKLDRNSGKVSFPSGGARELLAADRTYYVRTDGSDGNSGLVNSAGGAFLTIQKAVNVVFGTLDLAGFNVTIQVADGVYAGSTSASTPQVGAGLVTIRGNATAPSNVVLQVTSGSDPVIKTSNYTTLHVQDVKLVNTGGVGAAPLLLASKGGVITFQNIDCGQAVQQLRAEDGGRLECIGNYVISAGAASHWVVVNAQIRVQSKTITIVGTPAFTTFTDATRIGLILVNANTFSGSATGARYGIIENSVIMTGGAGATYLPGNAAGSTATGGQYV